MKDFREKCCRRKKAIPQSKEKKDLKAALMGNSGDLFHELHYVYKDKYNAKKDALNRKGKNKFYYTKLRLTNDYLYESEEEEEEKQADKIPDKKEPPKKSTKSDAKELMN